jgi:hypothetical protein
VLLPIEITGKRKARKRRQEELSRRRERRGPAGPEEVYGQDRVLVKS